MPTLRLGASLNEGPRTKDQGLRTLPQSYRRPPRKSIDRQLAAAEADFQGVRLPPAGVVGPVAVGQEVDPLVRGPDPAARGVGLVAQVRAVHEDVGQGQ